MTDDVLNLRHGAEGLTLHLQGRVDAHEAPRIGALFAEHLGPGVNRVAVDLGGVTFIDHKALIALRLGREVCRANRGELEVVALSAPARVIFELTELGRDMLPEQVSARRGQAARPASANLRIDAGSDPGSATLKIFGRLDALTGRSIRQEAARRLSTWRSVVADLTAAAHLDSPGLATLVWLTSELRHRHGDFAIRVAQGSEVHLMLRLAGFERFAHVDAVAG